MSAYAHLAKYYDQWMDQETYDLWVKWILERLKAGNLKGVKILEYCCGTGRVTLPLAKEGYSVWAVDKSEEMLAVGQEKSADLIKRIKWLLGDMLKLSLKEQFDAVLCINDGLNYLQNKEELRTFFEVSYKHLKQGGLLLFDWSSPYKLATVLGNATLAETHEHSAFIWENHYDDETKILHFEFHIFEELTNGTFSRSIESHQQISFSHDEVIEAARGLFKVELQVGDDFKNCKEKDQRIHMVMRRE